MYYGLKLHLLNMNQPSFCQYVSALSDASIARLKCEFDVCGYSCCCGLSISNVHIFAFLYLKQMIFFLANCSFKTEIL